MQDRPIDSALLGPRKQITRGDGEGLDQVEALLQQRGVHLPCCCPQERQPLREGRHRLFGTGGAQGRATDSTLRIRAHRLAAVALIKLKWRGLVRPEGRL